MTRAAPSSMQPEITFRDMPPSSALEATIQEWVGKLEHLCPLHRCTVVIEQPHKHGSVQSRSFQVHLTITVSGREIAVTRPAHHNAYFAVADTFRAGRRQLVDFMAQRRESRPVA